jgi:hypothetical protein
MRRSAGRAGSRLAVALGAQQPVDLAELAVGLLQLGGAAQEDIEPEVVADRHLVGQPAEVELQLGHALGELVAAALERGWLGRSRRGTDGTGTDAVDDRHLNVSEPVPPPAGLDLSMGGGAPGVTSVSGSLADFFE